MSSAGEEATEQQLRNLFGEWGWHPSSSSSRSGCCAPRLAPPPRCRPTQLLADRDAAAVRLPRFHLARHPVAPPDHGRDDQRTVVETLTATINVRQPRDGQTRSRRTSGPCGSSCSLTRTTSTTRSRPVYCTATCGGATPTPAIPTSWPPNAANGPASAARKKPAGADELLSLRDSTKTATFAGGPAVYQPVRSGPSTGVCAQPGSPRPVHMAAHAPTRQC